MVFFKHSFVLLLIDIFGFTVCKIGECHHYSSNEWFCCDNFEMRDRICEECNIGYSSLSKQHCVACTNNTYGMRCAEKCTCTAIERCDNVNGCVKASSAVNYSTYIFIEDTSIQPSLKTTDYRNHNDTSIQSSLKTTENREHSYLSLKPISIYSISVASLTFMLVIGIILIVYCRRHTGITRQRRDRQEQNTQQTSQTVER